MNARSRSPASRWRSNRVATVNNYSGVFGIEQRPARVSHRSTPQRHGNSPGSTREGKALSTVGDPGGHEQLALSPDGTRAIYRDVVSTLAGDLWVTDLTRGINDRFTSERTVGGFPVWSPDGSRIAFRSDKTSFRSRRAVEVTPSGS